MIWRIPGAAARRVAAWFGRRAGRPALAAATSVPGPPPASVDPDAPASQAKTWPPEPADPPWLSVEDCLARYPGRWHSIYSEQPARFTPPVVHGRRELRFQVLADQFRAAGLLELPDGLVLGHDGWVFSPGGHLLPELSWFGRYPEPRHLPGELPAPRRLRGVCLTIASHFARGNYGHFLLDALPRFHLFLRAGFTLADVDHVFCALPPSETAWRVYDLLGVPDAKRVWPGAEPVQADVMLAPSRPVSRHSYPPWVVAFLRELGGPSPAGARRRLYLSRAGHSRRVANEDGLLPLLAAHGFEIYRPSESRVPYRDFQAAEAVVGAHGAGLADLAFCAPGTQVVELLPSDHMLPHFYTVACSGGLVYRCVVGQSAGHTPPGTWGPSPYDFHVDEEDLRAALAGATEPGRPSAPGP